VVIVRSTTGHTFGAYASAPWTSAGGYTNAGGCFLFLVENPHNDAPTCFDCTDTSNAMYCHSGSGPSFGGGGDIGIFPGSDAGQSYTGFPHRYADTLGRGNATFTGASNFTPEDYEVWAVI
jgi:TLD